MTQLFIKREYKNAKNFEEDFFLDNVSGDSASLAPREKNEQFLGKFLSDKRLDIFLAVILLGLGVLFAKAFYLQAVRGDYYAQVAESNRTRNKPLLASRGIIYDSQNRPLVKNIPIFDAFILPKDLSVDNAKRQEQIKAIGDILGIKAESINLAVSKYPKNYKFYVALEENIDYQQAILLEIKASQVPGLYIETRNQRQYLYPYDFSHVIGYLGKISDAELAAANDNYLFNDYIGKTGLEANYEEILRGLYGREVAEIDSAGRQTKVLYSNQPTNGQDLVLSINLDLQKKAREVLKNSLQRYGKKRGAVIMEDVNNGRILAMVSYPDFDENLFAAGISQADYQKLNADANNPLFDRAIKGEYPSGSAIKPVVAIGALAEKIITDSTSFMSTGGLWLYNRYFFPDWAAGGHGATNVYKAIAWSVNTFFYIVGGGYQDFAGLGVDGLDKYFRLFGLGKKTGIDLPGEAGGLVPDEEWKKQTKNQDWFIGDTYHLAIGQGDLLVTPLQVVNYTAAIANGGTLYVPHVVKGIIGSDGIEKDIPAKAIRQDFIAKEYYDIVKKAMRQTVTSGSAQYLNSIGVAVAGKTGTAQWNSNKATHAWFTGFAPYDNPEVAITVLVEEGGEGSAVSVPITRDILNWYFNIYKVKSKDQSSNIK